MTIDGNSYASPPGDNFWDNLEPFDTDIPDLESAGDMPDTTTESLPADDTALMQWVGNAHLEALRLTIAHQDSVDEVRRIFHAVQQVNPSLLPAFLDVIQANFIRDALYLIHETFALCEDDAERNQNLHYAVIALKINPAVDLTDPDLLADLEIHCPLIYNILTHLTDLKYLESWKSNSELLPQSISLKLAAHILGDQFIANTSLEGAMFEDTAEVMAQALTRFSSHENTRQLAALLRRLGEIEVELHKNRDDLWHHNTPAERYRFFTNLAEEISSQPRVLLPGGWSGNVSGHAIVLETMRQTNETFDVIVYNTGSGLQQHANIQYSNRKFAYAGLCFKGVSEENLCNPETLRIILGMSSIRPPTSTGSYIDIRFYQLLIGLLDPSAMAPSNLDQPWLISPQRSGTCAWYVLMNGIVPAYLFPEAAAQLQLEIRLEAMSKLLARMEDPQESLNKSLSQLLRESALMLGRELIYEPWAANLSNEQRQKGSLAIRAVMHQIADFEQVQRSRFKSLEPITTQSYPSFSIEGRIGKWTETISKIASHLNLPLNIEEIPSPPSFGESLDSLNYTELLQLMNKCILSATTLCRNGYQSACAKLIDDLITAMPQDFGAGSLWQQIPGEEIISMLEGIYHLSDLISESMTEFTPENILHRIYLYEIVIQLTDRAIDLPDFKLASLNRPIHPNSLVQSLPFSNTRLINRLRNLNEILRTSQTAEFQSYREDQTGTVTFFQIMSEMNEKKLWRVNFSQSSSVMRLLQQWREKNENNDPVTLNNLCSLWLTRKILPIPYWQMVDIYMLLFAGVKKDSYQFGQRKDWTGGSNSILSFTIASKGQPARLIDASSHADIVNTVNLKYSSKKLSLENSSLKVTDTLVWAHKNLKALHTDKKKRMIMKGLFSLATDLSSYRTNLHAELQRDAATRKEVFNLFTKLISNLIQYSTQSKQLDSLAIAIELYLKAQNTIRNLNKKIQPEQFQMLGPAEQFKEAIVELKTEMKNKDLAQLIIWERQLKIAGSDLATEASWCFAGLILLAKDPSLAKEYTFLREEVAALGIASMNMPLRVQIIQRALEITGHSELVESHEIRDEKGSFRADKLEVDIATGKISFDGRRLGMIEKIPAYDATFQVVGLDQESYWVEELQDRSLRILGQPIIFRRYPTGLSLFVRGDRLQELLRSYLPQDRPSIDQNNLYLHYSGHRQLQQILRPTFSAGQFDWPILTRQGIDWWIATKGEPHIIIVDRENKRTMRYNAGASQPFVEDLTTGYRLVLTEQLQEIFFSGWALDDSSQVLIWQDPETSTIARIDYPRCNISFQIDSNGYFRCSAFPDEYLIKGKSSIGINHLMTMASDGSYRFIIRKTLLQANNQNFPLSTHVDHSFNPDPNENFSLAIFTIPPQIDALKTRSWTYDLSGSTEDLIYLATVFSMSRQYRLAGHYLRRCFSTNYTKTEKDHLHYFITRTAWDNHPNSFALACLAVHLFVNAGIDNPEIAHFIEQVKVSYYNTFGFIDPELRLSTSEAKDVFGGDLRNKTAVMGPALSLLPDLHIIGRFPLFNHDDLNLKADQRQYNWLNLPYSALFHGNHPIAPGISGLITLLTTLPKENRDNRLRLRAYARMLNSITSYEHPLKRHIGALVHLAHNPSVCEWPLRQDSTFKEQIDLINLWLQKAEAIRSNAISRNFQIPHLRLEYTIDTTSLPSHHHLQENTALADAIRGSMHQTVSLSWKPPPKRGSLISNVWINSKLRDIPEPINLERLFSTTKGLGLNIVKRLQSDLRNKKEFLTLNYSLSELNSQIHAVITESTVGCKTFKNSIIARIRCIRIQAETQELSTIFQENDLDRALIWFRDRSNADFTPAEFELYQLIESYLIHAENLVRAQEARELIDKIAAHPAPDIEQQHLKRLKFLIDGTEHFDDANLEKFAQLYHVRAQKILRAPQMEVIRRINSLTTEVCQIGCGGGKSSVVRPLTAEWLPLKKRFIIQIIPTAQIEEEMQNMHRYLLSSGSQKIARLTGERSLALLKKRVNVLKVAKEEGSVVMTTLPDLQSYLLSYFEVLSDTSKVPAAADDHSDKQLLCKLLDLFKDPQTGLMIDEIHETLRTERYLNYAIGPREEMPQFRWKTPLELFLFLHEIDSNTQINIPPFLRRSKDQESFSISSYYATQLPVLAKYLANRICGEGEAEIFERFLLIKVNQNDQVNELEEWRARRSDGEKLLLLRSYLQVILPQMLSLRYLVDYGPSKLSNTAVPYIANMIPSKDSSFSSYDVLVSLSILMVMHGGIPMDQMESLIAKWHRNHHSQIDVGVKSFETRAQITLTSRLKNSTNLQNYTIDQTDMKHKELTEFLRKHPDVIREYLEDHLLPSVKVQKEVMSSNAQDVVMVMFQTIFGLTATPANHLTYPSSLPVKWEEGSLLYNIETLLDEDCCSLRTYSIIDESDCVQGTSSPAAVLDPGAHFQGIASSDMALKLLKAANDGKTQAIYFDEESQQCMSVDRNGNRSRFNKKEKIPENAIVYLDPQNTIGVDLKFSEDSLIRVIVTPDLTLESLTQAISRARGLRSTAQKAELMLPPSTVNRMNELAENDFSMEALISLAIQNEGHDQQISLLPSLMQQAQAICRRRFLSRLMSGEEHLFERYRDLAISRIEHDEYKEWGSLFPAPSSIVKFTTEIQRMLGDKYSDLLKPEDLQELTELQERGRRLLHLCTNESSIKVSMETHQQIEQCQATARVQASELRDRRYLPYTGWNPERYMLAKDTQEIIHELLDPTAPSARMNESSGGADSELSFFRLKYFLPEFFIDSNIWITPNFVQKLRPPYATYLARGRIKVGGGLPNTSAFLESIAKYLPEIRYILMFSPVDEENTTPQFILLHDMEAEKCRSFLLKRTKRLNAGHFQLLHIINDGTVVAASGNTRPIPLRILTVLSMLNGMTFFSDETRKELTHWMRDHGKYDRVEKALLKLRSAREGENNRLPPWQGSDLQSILEDAQREQADQLNSGKMEDSPREAPDVILPDHVDASASAPKRSALETSEIPDSKRQRADSDQ
jgi:hypothetical protein